MPAITSFGTSSRIGAIEEMGFSNIHRRDDSIAEPQIGNTEGRFPDQSFTGEKLDYLAVDRLKTGTIFSQQITLGLIGGTGDIYIAGGIFDVDAWTATGGFILGLDDSDSDKEKFYLGNASSFIDWNVTTANTLTIAGTLSATAGTIGGWIITNGYIYNLQSGTPTASPNDGIVLASGNEALIVYEDTAKRVEVGYLSAGVYGIKVYDGAGSGTLFEVSDAQTVITGIPISTLGSGSEVAIQEWTYSGAFSVTDADTVAWAGGTLTMADGATFTITGSNTGNMAAFTYIYLDKAVSTILFQVSTSFTAGAGKVLIATAQNGTSEASYLLMGGSGDHNLDGGNIAASSIIAGKLSVSQLSAITADLGSITAGTITGGTIRTAASGTRFSMTSTAFQGFDASGNVVFEVIINGADAGDVIMGDDATGKYAKWDNSAGTFDIVGSTINASTTLQIGGSAITSTAAELNVLDGVSANVTATNLNTLMAGATSNADALHTHSIQTLQESFDSGNYFSVDIDVTTEASLGSLSGGLRVVSAGGAGPLFFAGGVELTPSNSNTTLLTTGYYNETGPSSAGAQPLLDLLLTDRTYLTFKATMISNAADDIYIGITDDTSSTPSNNDEMAMFFFDGGVLKCISATGDGVNTESTTPANITYNKVNTFTIFRDTSSVKFYVNNALVATHSTYIPNSGNYLLIIRHEAGGSGDHRTFVINPMKLYVHRDDWSIT